MSLRGSRQLPHLRMSVAALVPTLAAAPAAAAIDEIRLLVEGLACPFCTYAIEKNLKKLPDVNSVETSIRTGIVRVQVGSEARLEIKALGKAVSRSGFTLDRVEVTVTGRLISQSDRAALQAGPNGQIFLLSGKDGKALDVGTLGRLKAAAASGSNPLRIVGRVQGIDTPEVSVESFEATK